ncbi:Thymidylate kinase [Buchnera aphidicola (Tetraneura ulmi)]|uniref:dTMP kinase n=1 Tax=Buchnera aphidicola TaxID=9 RepID=UPI0034647086
MQNKFIVIEGIEGSGKTNACKQVEKSLKLFGINNSVLIREPGSTKIGEKIRKIVKEKNIDEKITKKTELLLMYAARTQLIETVIKPELKKGSWIISDRFDMSSIAYQGAGSRININLINNLKKFLVEPLYPDLILYLDIDPIIGLKRIKKNRKYLDRIEQKKISFFIRARKKYLELINLNPTAIKINANQKISIVNELVHKTVKKWLKKVKK